MVYKNVAPFLNGIELLGYTYNYTLYTMYAGDLMFYIRGPRVIILQNLGLQAGMLIFHSSTLDLESELRRTAAHNR